MGRAIAFLPVLAAPLVFDSGPEGAVVMAALIAFAVIGLGVAIVTRGASATRTRV